MKKQNNPMTRRLMRLSAGPRILPRNCSGRPNARFSPIPRQNAPAANKRKLTQGTSRVKGKRARGKYPTKPAAHTTKPSHKCQLWRRSFIAKAHRPLSRILCDEDGNCKGPPAERARTPHTQIIGAFVPHPRREKSFRSLWAALSRVPSRRSLSPGNRDLQQLP